MLARAIVLPALAVLLSVGGCAAPDRGAAPTAGGASFSSASQRLTPGRELDPGYAALEQRDYDRAISKADKYLAKAPHGEGSAEALYLKGRSLEGKNTAGVTGAQSISNLAGARSAYVQALAQNPKQPLLSYIRTSLGNVAYFQDDYPTAIAQLSTAFQELKDSEIKGWALYRIGLSQQRLGQFQQADETFLKIERDFRGSEPARRSAEHLGARGFYVQLATYADRATADKNAADLKARGITAVVAPATEGHSLLRAGPVASYNQAKYLKTQLAAQFPDSVVVP